jgi:hypothetical protein
MSLEEIKKKFIVSEAQTAEETERLITRLLNFCVVDEKGVVHISNSKLGGKEKVKVALAARNLASRLEPKIKATMTLAELAASTSLPKNQVKARAKDAADDKFAEKAGEGVYKAYPHKIEALIDSLEKSGKKT